jgi:hypothetical protein
VNKGTAGREVSQVEVEEESGAQDSQGIAKQAKQALVLLGFSLSSLPKFDVPSAGVMLLKWKWSGDGNIEWRLCGPNRPKNANFPAVLS